MNANDRQVGGGHYKGGSWQHWDWVVANRMLYLPAQVTKYVVRWQEKGGVQDLEKAAHYLDKLIEVHHGVGQPWAAVPLAQFIVELRSQYNLGLIESGICVVMACYQTPEELRQTKDVLKDLIEAARKG